MSTLDPDDLYHPDDDDDYAEEYTYYWEEEEKKDGNKYVHKEKQFCCVSKISGNRRSNGKRNKQKNTKKEKIKKFGKYGGGQRKRKLENISIVPLDDQQQKV